jgi:hypothetical protein
MSFPQLVFELSPCGEVELVMRSHEDPHPVDEDETVLVEGRSLRALE